MKISEASQNFFKKNLNPLHFHNTCFYQTGILGNYAKQNICNSKDELNKIYEAETRPKIFEPIPIEPTKKTDLVENFKKFLVPPKTTQ